MLRVSSLGLHLPPTTTPISLQCFRGPGAVTHQRALFFPRKSSPLHLSVHTRQSEDERSRTESFRLGGARCPGIFPSPVAENQLWAAQQVDKNGVAVGQRQKSDQEEIVRESANEVGIPLDSGSGAAAVEISEGDVEEKVIPSLNHFVQEAPFLSGKPWRRWPIKPLRSSSSNGYGIQRDVYIPSLEDELKDVERLHEDMLYVLATTCSAEDGWNAYSVLSKLQHHYDITKDDSEQFHIIPFAHLHRLARLIARNHPKTRTQFLRLLSVLTTLQSCGGKIQLSEWNALIDHAGKGLRKSRPEDFNNSLSIYYDMIYNRPPGSRFSSYSFDDILDSHHEDSSLFHPDHDKAPPVVEPDIHTYTTLIDIAARTDQPQLLQRATMLLKQAKLPPNRITHLALLKYFTSTKQLSGVRTTLVKMKEQRLEIGVDGLNACMWAYGHNDRLDVVMMIYRAFRHNLIPEGYSGEDDIASVMEQLRVEEGIVVSPEWKPNEVTFTLMIQTMAYHGNLLAALSVFIDMLSTPNVEQGAPLSMDKNGDLQPMTYSPTIHVFRALFLGFSRHGIGPDTKPRTLNPSDTNLEIPRWNLENLNHIFEEFLYLPSDTLISESLIFWIINSFSKTSNHDIELLRAVWQQTENRFGGFKWGSKHRLTIWRRKLFPETQEAADCG